MWKNSKEYEVIDDFKLSATPAAPEIVLLIEPKIDEEEDISV